MDNNEFLKKYQKQIETVGHDGIFGIMKSSHNEIDKNEYNTLINKICLDNIMKNFVSLENSIE